MPRVVDSLPSQSPKTRANNAMADVQTLLILIINNKTLLHTSARVV